jgi:hypothetical protein
MLHLRTAHGQKPHRHGIHHAEFSAPPDLALPLPEPIRLRA